jgi:hypothetical protein
LLACALVALYAMPAMGQSDRGARNGTSFRYVQVAPELAMSKRSSTIRLFDLIDRDGDGRLTDAELSSGRALSSDWIAMDSDSNGVITLAEFTALRAPHQLLSSAR